MDKDMARLALAGALQLVGEFRLHPLGFLYLRQPNEYGTHRRVHIWTSRSLADVRVHTTAHSHPYDVDSRIVKGKLKNRIFSFSEATDGAMFEFGGYYNGSASGLIPTGRKGMLTEVVSFYSSPTDDAYHLKRGVIHHAAPVSYPCITVVTTSSGSGSKSLSYGPADSEERFDRRFVTDTEREELKEALLSGIREHNRR